MNKNRKIQKIIGFIMAASMFALMLVASDDTGLVFPFIIGLYLMFCKGTYVDC